TLQWMRTAQTFCIGGIGALFALNACAPSSDCPAGARAPEPSTGDVIAPTTSPPSGTDERKSNREFDASRLVWDLSVVSPDGHRETFALSRESARLPITLPCGVGPVQRVEMQPEYYALRSLNCIHSGLTFTSLSLCAVEDGRLRSEQAFMTVGGGADPPTI